MISKQKEIFNELVDERLEEITDLDKKVDSDDLIYRYKGRTADAKSDKFDNALDITGWPADFQNRIPGLSRTF